MIYLSDCLGPWHHLLFVQTRACENGLLGHTEGSHGLQQSPFLPFCNATHGEAVNFRGVIGGLGTQLDVSRLG